MRGGTGFACGVGEWRAISIHPPREGWDCMPQGIMRVQLDISIHPPREGWDAGVLKSKSGLNVFQSTHPVRGGTEPGAALPGERIISIHPPREGWDGNGNIPPVR